jgi:hypothetical protein
MEKQLSTNDPRTSQTKPCAHTIDAQIDDTKQIPSIRTWALSDLQQELGQNRRYRVPLGRLVNLLKTVGKRRIRDTEAVGTFGLR